MESGSKPSHQTWRLRHQPFGGQLMSAVWAGDGVDHELLFASAHPLGSGAPVRGGIPVMFPQFNELGPLPKHGLVRTALWREAGPRARRAEDAALSYQLQVDPTFDGRWPHAARLDLTVHLDRHAVEITLAVENVGRSAFDWTGGLHPYFATTDCQAATLAGLAGCGLFDRYDASVSRERSTALSWTGEAFERLYAEAPPLTLNAGSHRLQLSCSGFDQWMIWNPGRELARAIRDLGPEDWRRFVCIEPVIVTRPSRLAPGEIFRGRLRVELRVN
jgi:glucose-6-phosphate 1-epimerase